MLGLFIDEEGIHTTWFTRENPVLYIRLINIKGITSPAIGDKEWFIFGSNDNLD